MFRSFMSLFGVEPQRGTLLFKPVSPLSAKPGPPKSYPLDYNAALADKADAEFLNQSLKRNDPSTKEFQVRLKEFEKFFICPIDNKILSNAVMSTNCGHVYSATNIGKYQIQALSNKDTCPIKDCSGRPLRLYPSTCANVLNIILKVHKNNNKRNTPVNLPKTIKQMSDSVFKELIDSLRCPYSLEVFSSPVLSTTCGHAFEKEYFLLSKDKLCPCCRKPISGVLQLFESHIFTELVEIITAISSEVMIERYFSATSFLNALNSWQLDSLALMLKHIYKMPRYLNEEVSTISDGKIHLLSYLCRHAQGLRLLIIDPRLRKAVTGAGLLTLINTTFGASSCIKFLSQSKDGIAVLKAIIKENSEVRLYLKKELDESLKNKLNQLRISIEPPVGLLTLSEAAWKSRLGDILDREDVEALQTFIHEYNEVKFSVPATPDYLNCVITWFENINATPLNIATSKNNVTLLAMLISAGAQPGVLQPNVNYLPIHQAIIAGAFAVLDYLLSPEVGVDVNAKDRMGFTALFLAVIYEQIQGIKILGLAHAAMDDKNSAGETAVMLATTYNNLPAVQELIIAKANLDIPNAENMAPVHVAAKNNYHEILDLLIVSNANINVRIGCQLTGVTALYLAVDALNLESVCIMLRYPQTLLNLVYANNMTVIFLAAKKHDARIFTTLFGKDADVTIPMIDAPNRVLSLWRYLKYLPGWCPDDEMNFSLLQGKIPRLSAKTYGEYSTFEMIECAYPATCRFGSDGNVETYTQVVEMGDTRIMQAPTGLKFIAVKKVQADSKEWEPSWDEQDLIDLLIDKYAACEREARFNSQMYGIGAVYYDKKPIEANQGGDLISYPECYIATNYITGVPLKNYGIQQGEEFVGIFKSLFKNLKRMHRFFIHGSISSDKIMIDGDDADGYIVKLTDFACSRESGHVLNLQFTDYYPNFPEFKDQTYIAVAASQDMYAMGLVLKKYYKSNLFPAAIARVVKDTIKNMLHKDPSKRMTAALAVKSFRHCEYLYELEYLRQNPQELALRYATTHPEKCFGLIIDTGIDYFKDLIASIQDVVNISAKLATVQEKERFYGLLGKDFLLNLKTPDYTDHGSIIAYVNFVTSTLSKADADEIIKNLFAPLILKKGFEAAFVICDTLHSSPQCYKQVLGVFNKIYQERRRADSRNYFSFFGIFSKTDKLAASAGLDDYLERNVYVNFHQLVLMDGDLGSIATRIHGNAVLEGCLQHARPQLQR